MEQLQMLEPKRELSISIEKESSPQLSESFLAEMMEDEEFMSTPIVKELAEETDSELISMLKVDNKGWNVLLFENEMKMSEDLLCAICKNVCVDAVELGCDHNDDDIYLYCNNCLRQIIIDNDRKCPINKHKDALITLNRSIRRQISKAIVICPYSMQFKQRNNDNDIIINNNGNGCIWKGTLRDLKINHLKICTPINNPSYVINKQTSIIQELQIINSDLKNDLNVTKANENRLQIKLNNVQMNLIELKAKCNTSVEIVGRLGAENDDLRTKMREMETKSIKLKHKQKSREQIFQHEIIKYQQELKWRKKELNDLEQGIITNDDEYTKTEKQLLKLLKNEQKKVIEAQKDIDDLNEMAQKDLMTANLQIEHLEREKDEYIALLEEVHYENQMIKNGYGMNRENKINSKEEEDEMDETFENLGFMDAENVKEENVKEVVDLTREYLHMTASVVKMKFPRVQHISSEELINKVKNYQLWEYHDMMVRIMKGEQHKLMRKEKEKQEKKKANTSKQQEEQQNDHGMLVRFRSSIHKININPNKLRTINGSQQKGLKTRWNIKHSINMQDAKKTLRAKTKKVSQKAMVFKDNAAKKLTGKPSQDQVKNLCDTSFASVPGLNSIYQEKMMKHQQNNNNKEKKSITNQPKKPHQSL